MRNAQKLLDPRHLLPGATQQTPRAHSFQSPTAWTTAAPSMSHQLCRIHPQKEMDRTLERRSNWRKLEEFEGPGEKKKKDTWMWMERRE
ncbi:hypothetical protein L5515_012866 [Caenorhabditis briggsae]|uniref:Uncharacterized protein n=1 Tax=Caenorhabditis briggsae TaxID=6238 RepID=A0AAE9EYT4_CAEBR|nr:hypothetical protein L5515_012866 [Caenorhabditis briggsae]